MLKSNGSPETSSRSMKSNLTELRVDVPFECPRCKTMAYFTRENQWPSDLEARLGTGAVPTAPSKSASRPHVAVWSCVGCKSLVTLIYPTRLWGPAVKIWPIGSSRTLEVAGVPRDLIPENIRKDFLEASLIEDMSPTASATLSRRCLQSILKDRFLSDVKAFQRLKRQVQAVLDGNRLPDYIADELHGIRSIGNDAAHENVDPETDQIIDVEPGEAGACLDVIEDLIRHCYVDPYKAKERKIAREKKHGKDED